MKDFDAWNGVKKQIDKSERKLFPKERQIWYCAVGINVGFEENGKGDDYSRPVLVFRVFSKDVFLGIPLTSTLKSQPFYHPLLVHGTEGSAILSQIRLFDKKRLLRYLTITPASEFAEIEMSLYRLLFSKDNSSGSRKQ